MLTKNWSFAKDHDAYKTNECILLVVFHILLETRDQHNNIGVHT